MRLELIEATLRQANRQVDDVIARSTTPIMPGSWSRVKVFDGVIGTTLHWIGKYRVQVGQRQKAH